MNIPIPNTGQNIQPFDNSKIKIEAIQSPFVEYKRAIIALNCLTQAIFEFLPPESQTQILSRFESLLSEKNLKVVR